RHQAAVHGRTAAVAGIVTRSGGWPAHANVLYAGKALEDLDHRLLEVVTREPDVDPDPRSVGHEVPGVVDVFDLGAERSQGLLELGPREELAHGVDAHLKVKHALETGFDVA